MYKRPESVLVVIYTKALEILVLQRRDVPDFWQSVTGSLQTLETPIEAAKREVWEETGLISNQLHDCQHKSQFAIQPPWRSRYAPSVTHNIEHTFTLLLPIRQSVQLNSKEHVSYQWLPCRSALEKISSYTNRQAILKWISDQR